MNRRRFLKALIAGAASVAVGMKLATKQPKVPDPDWIGVDMAAEPSHSVHWKAYFGAPIVNPAHAVRINSI